MAIQNEGYGFLVRDPATGAPLSGALVEMRKDATIYVLQEAGTSAFYQTTTDVPTGKYSVFVDSTDTGRTVAVGAGQVAALGNTDDSIPVSTTDEYEFQSPAQYKATLNLDQVNNVGVPIPVVADQNKVIQVDSNGDYVLGSISTTGFAQTFEVLSTADLRNALEAEVDEKFIIINRDTFTFTNSQTFEVYGHCSIYQGGERLQWSNASGVSVVFNDASGGARMSFYGTDVIFNDLGNSLDYTINVSWFLRNANFGGTPANYAIGGTGIIFYEKLTGSVPAGVTIPVNQSFWDNTNDAQGGDLETTLGLGNTTGAESIEFEDFNNSTPANGQVWKSQADGKLKGYENGVQFDLNSSQVTSTYSQTFTDANLVSGSITINHQLNSEVVVQVYNGSNKLVFPSEIEKVDNNNTKLTFNTTLVGTYKANIVAGGGVGSGSGEVTSVFGRDADVVAEAGDYSADQITNAMDLNTIQTVTASKTWSASQVFDGLVDVNGGVSLDSILTNNAVIENSSGSVNRFKNSLGDIIGTLQEATGNLWLTHTGATGNLRLASDLGDILLSSANGRINITTDTSGTAVKLLGLDGTNNLVDEEIPAPQDLASVLAEGNYATTSVHIGGSAGVNFGSLTDYMNIDGEGSGLYIRVRDKTNQEIIRFNDASLNGGDIDMYRKVNLISVSEVGTSGAHMVIRNDTTGELQISDIPTGGSTNLTGSIDPQPTDASWSGNTYYQYDITVTGAQVGDAVSVNLSDNILNTIITANAGIEALTGRVTATNNVKVAIRVTGFITLPTGGEIICAVMQP